MTKEIKITVVEQHELEYDFENDQEFKDPSAFYIINALAQRIYIHVRSRQEATDWVKEHYDGRYVVRAAKLQKSKGDVTCSGTSSRKGMSPQLRKTV